MCVCIFFFFFFQAEDGIRDKLVTGVQTCALPICAAEYVRMSTEHQKYSTENQADAIRRYADQRGLDIVRSYEDDGKSGLRLDGRAALQRLLDDVRERRADFTVILVYDVSRWGRFQDAD